MSSRKWTHTRNLMCCSNADCFTPISGGGTYCRRLLIKSIKVNMHKFSHFFRYVDHIWHMLAPWQTSWETTTTRESSKCVWRWQSRALCILHIWCVCMFVVFMTLVTCRPFEYVNGHVIVDCDGSILLNVLLCCVRNHQTCRGKMVPSFSKCKRPLKCPTRVR